MQHGVLHSELEESTFATLASCATRRVASGNRRSQLFACVTASSDIAAILGCKN